MRNKGTKMMGNFFNLKDVETDVNDLANLTMKRYIHFSYIISTIYNKINTKHNF